MAHHLNTAPMDVPGLPKGRYADPGMDVRRPPGPRQVEIGGKTYLVPEGGGDPGMDSTRRASPDEIQALLQRLAGAQR